MSDGKFADLIMSVMTVGVIACCFFWVSSCQKTEIIKACLASAPEPRKFECIGLNL